MITAHAHKMHVQTVYFTFFQHVSFKSDMASCSWTNTSIPKISNYAAIYLLATKIFDFWQLLPLLLSSQQTQFVLLTTVTFSMIVFGVKNWSRLQETNSVISYQKAKSIQWFTYNHIFLVIWLCDLSKLLVN